jgi:two-component system phosphate regulon sensor histidine kinase PhoR
VTQKHKAEQLRREFTANVSHELKTPLHAISGYAELMSQGMARPEDTHRFSGQIYNEAQRMIRLVEDIIRLSQLDEGAANTAPEPVELYGLVQEILDGLTVEAQEAQVTLQIQGHPLTAVTIPHLLRGIVKNLCDNSIKYNRPGGNVTVTVAETAKAFSIAVADTGIGIEKEHQSRIFERFYRVDKSHSKAVGGTGLGLSIVKHAAITLGAQLELDSQPNVGTTVTISLPK